MFWLPDDFTFCSGYSYSSAEVLNPKLKFVKKKRLELSKKMLTGFNSYLLSLPRRTGIFEEINIEEETNNFKR